MAVNREGDPLRNIPESHGLIGACRTKQFSIRRKCNLLHPVLVASQQRIRTSSPGPEPDHAIFRRSGQIPPIRRELGTAHVVAVLKDSAGAIEEIPQAGRMVATGRGKKMAVRWKCQA